MAILAFQQPDKVIMLSADNAFSKFEFRPLEPGYGITIGNSLRRILLSSLEGFAISSVKIVGVDHEFTTIPGVIENVVEFILNLKKIRFKRIIDGIDNEKITVVITGQSELTAGLLNNFLNSFEVLNTDQLICRMEPEVKLQFDLIVKKGRGYVPAEENRPETTEFGVIPIDSIHTPIKNVKWAVENWRVEQKTDYEKLILEITTDGSISPKDALKEAANILIHHFMLFTDERKITEELEMKIADDGGHNDYDEDSTLMSQLLSTRLSDMDLSVRALNCLKTSDIDLLADLVKLQRNDLMKFRNFGKKSLTELDELLTKNNLSFGMDITKYKIERKIEVEKDKDKDKEKEKK
ncbi:MAG: DNA-directed RNA polymerase subunit alpha [Prevotellaceae bacterium]|jgi:DNA-directed RNA polymerase subunit alpha|nr:DNA-directed RNA polymerase subunit alpha [Prevotellaceae bacterium]